MDQVVDPKRFEHEDHGAQVGALDLGDRVVLELVEVRPLGVQPEALSRRHAARAACALIGRRLGHGRHDQRLHACAWVVRVLLGEARVDDVHNIVDGDRGLGDVGREHHLARAGRRRLKDLGLHVARQVGVDWEHEQLGDLGAEAACACLQRLLRGLNLLLAGEEDEDVAVRLRYMDLQHGDHARLEIVSLGRLGIQDVDGVAPARDVEHRRVIKVL